MFPVKTPIASKMLGISYATIIGMIRHGRIKPPKRDSSGDFLWTAADLRNIRKAAGKDRRRKSKGIKGAVLPTKAD